MLIDGATLSEMFLNLSGDPRLNRYQQSAAYKIGMWQQDQEGLAAQFREAEDRGDEAAQRELDELGMIHRAARPFRFGVVIPGCRVFVCEGCQFFVTPTPGGTTMAVEFEAPKAR